MWFKNNKKGVGVLGALIMGVMSLFVVGIVFALLNYPFLTMYDVAENISNESFAGDTTISTTMSYIKNTWVYIPLLLIVVIIIFIVAQAIKPEVHNIE